MQQLTAGHVPTYPVHQVGQSYAETSDSAAAYSEPTSRLHSDRRTFAEDEGREPTPPLFKPIGDKTLVAPPSVRGTGTMPPPRTDPPRDSQPPPRHSEPPPQSTTSPNTPLPDASPLPPPADVTPPASHLDLDALDADATMQANVTQKVAPLRTFVEDGKTTQLSFTSQAHPFALTVEQYASLCAERDLCTDDAERARKIHKRYEIGDKRAKGLVDRLFKLRFEEDPELEESWRAAYERFTKRFRDRASNTDTDVAAAEPDD